MYCLTFFVSVPYEASAAPKKGTKKERRERLKREEAARKRRQKTPPKKKITPQLNSQNPQKTLHSLIEKLQKNDKISSEYRQIIITSLTELSKTPTGRYIFSNIPDDINFIVAYGATPGSYGRKNLRLTPSLFDHILAEDSISEKECIHFHLTDLIAHELIHASQSHLGICSLPNISLEDHVTLRKFREMHALLEEECAKTELLESPFFKNYRNDLEKTGKLDTFFILKVQNEQIKIGISPEKARRFARTEFVRSYWTNTPDTPVRVGNKNLTVDRNNEIASWNSSYNDFYSSVVNREDYKKNNKTDIRPELKEALDIIGLDLTPEFIVRNKSFSLEKGRLIGYTNGIKNQEIDALGKGRVVKKLIRNKLHILKIEMPNKENKSYKEYFHDTKTLKATYTIGTDGNPGVYREYDRKGQQIIEAPVNNNGELEGNGWVLENDETVKKEFRDGFVLKR